MKNILITGASGNVGTAIINNLRVAERVKIWKGTHAGELKGDERYFNFDDLVKTKSSLTDIDVLFLLRPPHISDTNRYFKPLIDACVEEGVKHIVFLSVQGAEKSTIIPHNRIEKLIRQSGIAYTFIRPSYFMQNLTTTLLNDIKSKNLIFLPAGKAKFLWVDVNDIGKAIAHVLTSIEAHSNKIYVITGKEYFSFHEVALQLTDLLQKPIRFESPNLIRFYLQKKKEGVNTGYIIVMIMLHYLARFESTPAVSSDFTTLTGDVPNTLANFLFSNKDKFINKH